jgi:hypothetical protein
MDCVDGGLGFKLVVKLNVAFLLLLVDFIACEALNAIDFDHLSANIPLNWLVSTI